MDFAGSRQFFRNGLVTHFEKYNFARFSEIFFHSSVLKFVNNKYIPINKMVNSRLNLPDTKRIFEIGHIEVGL